MAIKVDEPPTPQWLRQKIGRPLRGSPALARGWAQTIIVGLICFGSPAAPLQWTEGPGYRSALLPVSKSGKAGFTLLPPQMTGINFTNLLTDEKTAENQIRLNGSGVACGDVDGDGWCDVYLCGLENGR